jgi:hypothetical protein
MDLAVTLKENPPNGKSSFLKEYIDAYNNIGMLEMDIDNLHEAQKILTKGLEICDEEEIGDLPPGFEKNSQTIFPHRNSKFRPSRLVECNPKITEYVAAALCRQKLHDEVLEEWKFSILDSTVKQIFMSSCTLKKKFQSRGHEVRTLFNIYENLNLHLVSLNACLCCWVLFHLILVS